MTTVVWLEDSSVPPYRWKLATGGPPLLLGRGLFNIDAKTVTVSRKHVELTLSPEGKVHVTAVGVNSILLARNASDGKSGTEMKKNIPIELGPDDCFAIALAQSMFRSYRLVVEHAASPATAPPARDSIASAAATAEQRRRRDNASPGPGSNSSTTSTSSNSGREEKKGGSSSSSSSSSSISSSGKGKDAWKRRQEDEQAEAAAAAAKRRRQAEDEEIRVQREIDEREDKERRERERQQERKRLEEHERQQRARRERERKQDDEKTFEVKDTYDKARGVRDAAFERRERLRKEEEEEDAKREEERERARRRSIGGGGGGGPGDGDEEGEGDDSPRREAESSIGLDDDDYRGGGRGGGGGGRGGEKRGRGNDGDDRDDRRSKMSRGDDAPMWTSSSYPAHTQRRLGASGQMIERPVSGLGLGEGRRRRDRDETADEILRRTERSEGKRGGGGGGRDDDDDERRRKKHDNDDDDGGRAKRRAERKQETPDDHRKYRTPDLGIYCVAFPSISTAEFEFNVERAVATALRVIDNFLLRHKDPRLRLVLVDANPGSSVVESFKTYTRDPRFMVHVGDMTTLRQQNMPCRYIVNITNWRFKGSGDMLNSAVNTAAGPWLSSKCVESWGTAKVVLGPNMNRNRPDCLDDDYRKGVKELRKCYEEVLACFYSLTSLPPPPPMAPSDHYLMQDWDSTDLDFLSSAPKKKAAPLGGGSGGGGGGGGGGGEGKGEAKKTDYYLLLDVPAYNPPKSDGKVNAGGGIWKAGLAVYLNSSRPAEITKSVFWEDEYFVCVYDKFPKGRMHLLLMPKQCKKDRVSQLTRDDITMLKKIHNRAQWITRGLTKKHPNAVFRTGFHAVPSMAHLHMHIISQDFESVFMKTKKHWNSFTTEFFISSKTVITRITEDGALVIDKKHYENLIANTALLCHRCRSVIRTFPQLMTHISTCTQDVAAMTK